MRDIICKTLEFRAYGAYSVSDSDWSFENSSGVCWDARQKAIGFTQICPLAAGSRRIYNNLT